jgi:hypothetical protein
MESKFYFITTILLIGGLVGGYLVASTNQQNQAILYELRLQSKDSELQTKVAQLQAKDALIQQQMAFTQSQENLIMQLKENVTTLALRIEQLEDIIKSWNQTQVRIDSLTWEIGSFALDIRNTGSINVLIKSLSIRANQEGGEFYTFKIPSVNSFIPVGALVRITLNYQWVASASYVIRVETSSGLCYEAVFTSPTI